LSAERNRYRVNKILFITFVIVLFGGMLFGYSLIMTSAPVAIAQAQAQVITARSDAEISQWYAQAALADRTAARERQTAYAPWYLAIASIILAGLITVAVIIFGAVSFEYNRRRDYAQPERIVLINGRYYRAFEEHGGRVIGLEPISAPRGVLERVE